MVVRNAVRTMRVYNLESMKGSLGDGQETGDREAMGGAPVLL